MDHARPRPIPLRILGTGEYVPSRRIESAEFDQRWGKSPGWTRRHVGIDYRHLAGPDEPGSLMAAHAAREALRNAGLEPTTTGPYTCPLRQQPQGYLTRVVQRTRLGG